MADDTIRMEGSKLTRLKTGKFATIIVKKDAVDMVYEFDYGDSAHDDSATLKSQDGSYASTVKFAEGQRLGNKIQLTFKNITLGKNYELSVDRGAEGGSYVVATNFPIDAAVAASKPVLYQGRFLNKADEKPLTSHYVYVDVPGDDKVVVKNKIKTSSKAGVGGMFMPGTAYNFYVTPEDKPVADVEKLTEADLQKETATAPHRDTCVFKLEIKGAAAVVSDESFEPPHIGTVEVVGSLPIADARAPHVAWSGANQEVSEEHPALILHNAPLKLMVRLFRGKGSGEGRLICKIKDKSGAISKSLESKVDCSSFGKEDNFVEMQTADNLTEKVAVNELTLEFSIEAQGKTHDLQKLPLRVYTVHKTPVDNRVGRGSLPLVTKVHLEHACRWANGASENIGQGPKSIAHQIDNQMRHYVHPKDFGAHKDYATVYKSDAKPVNYKDLPGYISGGLRSVSALYYPPLEVKHDYEKYHPHYVNNFGWALLDNLTHTGGRCNQQAALICDILGTVGIKASVYYLQRTGKGKTTRRPVRQYFNCYAGGQYWNFHGIVKCEMGDGSFHMYDGSFSSPPNRKHGDEAWAIGERGPFIYSWEKHWKYEDHDVSAFFHDEVLTAVYEKCDTAFPEFGWKKEGSQWVASNESVASKLGCKPEEITYGGGWSLKAKDKSISWLSWAANQGRSDPTGSASMDAAMSICRKVGIDPDQMIGAVPADDAPETWEGVPKPA